MEIISGIISAIVIVITYLLYTISGGVWFSDNYKTQEVGNRCVERDYKDDVFDKQEGFNDKVLCEMYALKESDHASTDYNLEPIRNVFDKMGFEMFLPKDFVPDTTGFDSFIKNKTYVHLVKILSADKNIYKIYDIMNVEYFTWLVYNHTQLPVTGDKAKNYKNYNKKNILHDFEPTYMVDLIKKVEANPDKLFGVIIEFMDMNTFEISDSGHVISIILSDGAIHVNDSNVLPDWNYFTMLQPLTKYPIKGNYDNYLYSILYPDKGALQSSASDKYFSTFGNCQSWQFIIMLIYLSNPTKKPEVIVSLLLALGDGAKILLMNYWYYVYMHNLSELSLGNIWFISFYELTNLIKKLKSSNDLPLHYRLTIGKIYTDIIKVQMVPVFIAIDNTDTENKKQIIFFCKIKMPIIISEITNDLKSFESQETTDANGNKKIIKKALKQLPNNYIQSICKKHGAPDIILKIWNEKQEFCTIL